MYTGDNSVSFHTELTRDVGVETSTEGHNLYVEIKDEKSAVSFFDRAELETSRTTTSQVESKLIKLGSGKYTIGTRDEEHIWQFNYSGDYQLSIFDEYLGHRRLITSKPISWFASLD